MCVCISGLPVCTIEINCLRFANPAEALGGRHSEAWSLRGMETWKLGGSDMLILGSSWIFLMAS